MLFVMVNERTKPNRAKRDEEHIATTDNTCCKHRLGLEIYPKCQSKPQETRRNVGDECIYQDLVKTVHIFLIACH